MMIQNLPFLVDFFILQSCHCLKWKSILDCHFCSFGTLLTRFDCQRVVFVIINRNRVGMEKAKSNLGQSFRAGSKNKLNTSGLHVKASKSGEVSLLKNNSNKASLKNIIKTPYMRKNSSKKNNESILNSPSDTTALLSCISTPNARSHERAMLRKIVRGDINISKEWTKQIIEDNFVQSDDGFRIVFLANQKLKFQKNFPHSCTMDQVMKYVVKELKTYSKTHPQLAFYGFYTVDCNIGIDKLLKNPATVLEDIRSCGFSALKLKVLTAKGQPNYSNLEFGDFKLMKFLGSGGFSSVFLARCMVDGRLCALKFIKKSSIVTENKYKMLENQRNILFTIDHQRLVDLYYAIESKNYIIFGLEYCPNGNLYQLLQKRKIFSESEAKFLFSQILEGLHSLHTQKILFRDMKLQNILFDENGNVKITDFGLSKPDINQEDVTYSYCGSPEYMAPEMLAKTGHSYQIDYYALGILLYELLYGHSPFFALKKQDIFHAILHSEPQFPKQPSISKELKSLIKGLLQKNPKHRIGSLKGTEEIKAHPWLRGYTTSNIESPFKSSYNSQKQKFESQFAEDLKTVVKEKLFFSRSFINKRLVEELQQTFLSFNVRANSEKMMRRSDKGRPTMLR